MPPKHAVLVEPVLKFAAGFSLVGMGIWKGSSMLGGDHHDHTALESTETAKTAEKLLRRHTSQTHSKSGALHPESEAKKHAI